jgi:phosphoglycerate dehydrogenase-like enzyme
VGNILIQLGANVSYFQRNDNLFEKTKHADVVINCLSLTPETKNILNHNFFSALKDGVIYITSSKSEIHDIETIKKHVAT